MKRGGIRLRLRSVVIHTCLGTTEPQFHLSLSVLSSPGHAAVTDRSCPEGLDLCKLGKIGRRARLLLSA